MSLWNFTKAEFHSFRHWIPNKDTSNKTIACAPSFCCKNTPNLNLSRNIQLKSTKVTYVRTFMNETLRLRLLRRKILQMPIKSDSKMRNRTEWLPSRWARRFGASGTEVGADRVWASMVSEGFWGIGVVREPRASSSGFGLVDFGVQWDLAMLGWESDWTWPDRSWPSIAGWYE